MADQNSVSILSVGAECAPFAKTGGLADVLGTLPGELNKLGLDARVLIPLHKQIKEKYAGELKHICSFYILLGANNRYVGIETMEYRGVTYYFIDNEYYFGYEIYKGGQAEAEQYAFFSRAILEALPYIGFMPDVIHVNDWHTAIIPVLLKTQYQGKDQGNIRTVLTIHNLFYQGKYDLSYVKYLFGLEDRYLTPDYLEAYGCADILKGGIVFADKITTVSPAYASEIRVPYFAEGLEGILNARSRDLIGILNGIDTTEFDPQTDPDIPFHYGIQNIEEKYNNKLHFMKERGLKAGADTALVGMVSRLTEQKGIDLIMAVLDEIMQEGVCLMMLGNGDRKYEEFFLGAADRYPGKISVCLDHNAALAHQIYAASDFFLMPSKFEPCGISQMIAMRYGTLPIVRETGGLKDTVTPYDRNTGKGNGFSFTNYNAHDMLWAIRYAMSVYKDKVTLLSLMEAAMEQDHSFMKSAKEYAEIFKSLQ